MLNAISIGSSSSGNSYLIRSEHTNILLDLGLAARRIKEAVLDSGIGIEDIDGICITHEHIDHVRSIRAISGWAQGAEVFASWGTVNECENFSYVPDERLHLVSAQQCFEIGDVSVRTFSLSHDAAEPIGYSFSSGGDTLTVITDTGYISDEIFEEMASANKLILEGNHEVRMLEVGPYPYILKRRILGEHGHLSNEAAGDALSRVLELRRDDETATRVMLAHLSTTNNTPDNAEITVADILRVNGFKAGEDYSICIAAKCGATPL